jgi:glutathione S-transferase
MSLTLAIGNKNYSSWSMRPWLVLKHFGIAFTEHMVWFDGGFGASSAFRKNVSALSPTGKVPLLDVDGFKVWDTLAIIETIAERFPEHAVWPRDANTRARARSICAEMHSGFTGLRSNCPMNIEADLREQGELILRDKPAVTSDLKRIDTLWSEALAESGGPHLFGEWSAADAYFAPVCMRITSYGLGDVVSAAARAYVERMRESAALKSWIADALAEKRFVTEDEPYRVSRG